MVVHISSKLITHLRGDERVSNVVGIIVVVEVRQVQTDVFTYYIYRSTTGECWVHIHHAGIKAIAGVSSHMTVGRQLIIALIPVTEAHEVAMLQLTALRHTSRARGVEHDEEIVRSNLNTLSNRSIRKFLDILGQQHIALILIYYVTQRLVGYQQLSASILHHEVQALLRIAWVERLVGTTCLEHTK